MKYFNDFLSIFNGITPIIIIIFLLVTHGNYVNINEYEYTKKLIFDRLDNVELLIYKILNNTATDQDILLPKQQVPEK